MIVWNQRFVIGLLLAAASSATVVGCRDSGPKLTVFLPKQSSHFARGDTVHFAAELNSDVDFGVIDRGAWRWVSSVDGEIGTGPRLDTPNLSVGEHQVTASVRHKLGLSSDSVTIVVDSIILMR
jgi:hypothetical protein